MVLDIEWKSKKNICLLEYEGGLHCTCAEEAGAAVTAILNQGYFGIEIINIEGEFIVRYRMPNDNDVCTIKDYRKRL